MVLYMFASKALYYQPTSCLCYINIIRTVFIEYDTVCQLQYEPSTTHDPHSLYCFSFEGQMPLDLREACCVVL